MKFSAFLSGIFKAISKICKYALIGIGIGIAGLVMLMLILMRLVVM